jgi:phosphoribosylanthranilate isomerase
MITQIYETSSPVEARTLSVLGVDHIGILVGAGTFPREQSLESAVSIVAAITSPSKASALFLSVDIKYIVETARALAPDLVHLGAATELLSPDDTRRVKALLPRATIIRSIPVVGEEAIALARSYEGVADMLLLDSHAPGDAQIGALGVTHDWDISRRIVDSVRLPVILAGGLGPENVADAIHKFALQASIPRPGPMFPVPTRRMWSACARLSLP